jgi:non-homologous end joining protein Ku
LPTSLGLKHEAIRAAREQQGEVVDLMAALRESVERTKKQRKAPSKREAS